VCDFTTGEEAFSRSIARDASTVGRVTVTVAVLATRTEEWDVLDSIFSHSEEIGFRPFLDKANDLQYDENVAFFESVSRTAPDRIGATTHFGRDGSDPERVEAVQSAIHVTEFSDSDALVLVDGGREKASTFVKAVGGIASTIPATTHCIRAEQYFPTALLADICAGCLAHEIARPEDCRTVSPVAPESKRKYDAKWGKAFSSLYDTPVAYERTPVSTKRGRTVSERIHCWYEGHVATDEMECPMTDSLAPIVRFAGANGYQQVVERLSEL